MNVDGDSNSAQGGSAAECTGSAMFIRTFVGEEQSR